MASVNERLDRTLDPCLNCGSNDVTTRIEQVEFEYGEGESAPTLSARVPVRVCRSCKFEYEDEVAEASRHDAVCKHLGYLTPRDITAMRERFGMNRAKFADLSKIGVATLARWEKGALIQNPANDRYLRLLSDPRNIEALGRLDRLPDREDRVVVLAGHRFSPQIEGKREAANQFALHVAG